MRVNVQVGEKTAMRRRLLNGWQFIRQLKVNQNYQNFYRHLMQSLIILLTFASVLTGVMSYQVKVAVDRGMVRFHQLCASILCAMMHVIIMTLT